MHLPLFFQLWDENFFEGDKPFTTQPLCLTTPNKRGFWKHCGKPAFSPFLTMFCICFTFPSAKAFNLDNSKNLSPNNKILDWYRWKEFADNKLNVAEMMVLMFNRVENINVGWSWTIIPEVPGSPPGLVRTFLRYFMFPIQLEVNWFETQR